ncbi:MAG: hypothetical protein COA53_00260 [Rhodobacteraceae bacterium]|nr:MAG: hypothetical protein COA53_00260 [Paracoccaceae bacterium]
MFKKLSTALLIGVTTLSSLPAQSQTTAAEVKPVLTMIKGMWVSIREYDGNDQLYFTMLESYRCGLDGVKYGINSDVADQVWEQETCYTDEAAPNAMKMEDGLPFISLDLGSIESVIVEITYDDGTTDTETYQRAAIMTP